MSISRKKWFGIDSLLETLKASMLPSGAIVWFGNRTTAPSGWAICDGSNGTPNLIDRYPLGSLADIGTTVDAGLPNIEGWIDTEAGMQKSSGCFSKGNEKDDGGFWGTGVSTNPNAIYDVIYFDAHSSNSIYGNSQTVTPPSTRLLPCMKL